MPTSATMIPGVDRVNWMARCASVARPGSNVLHRIGHMRQTLRSASGWPEATTAMPRLAAACQNVLRAVHKGFHHSQVERQLDEPEMVPAPPSSLAICGQARQAQRVLLAKAVPCGAPYQRIFCWSARFVPVARRRGGCGFRTRRWCGIRAASRDCAGRIRRWCPPPGWPGCGRSGRPGTAATWSASRRPPHPASGNPELPPA